MQSHCGAGASHLARLIIGWLWLHAACGVPEAPQVARGDDPLLSPPFSFFSPCPGNPRTLELWRWPCARCERALPRELRPPPLPPPADPPPCSITGRPCCAGRSSGFSAATCLTACGCPAVTHLLLPAGSPGAAVCVGVWGLYALAHACAACVYKLREWRIATHGSTSPSSQRNTRTCGCERSVQAAGDRSQLVRKRWVPLS